MNASSLLISDRLVAPGKPQLTAAQKALAERKVLPLNSLLHGAYYNGLLNDVTTIGRWHGQKRRFIFWEHNMDQPQSKATPHVADLGTGARFAPLAEQKSEGGSHLSDFAFETTR